MYGSRCPKITSSVVNHTIAKGDTLYSIAKKYSTTVDAIKKLSGLTSDVLTVGKTIRVK